MAHLSEDLTHLPSDPGDQDFLLRLLVHLVQVNGKVERSQEDFVEAVAKKMGRAEWEFPQESQRLEPGEITRVHRCWRSTRARLWLVDLLRSLATVDGLLDRDEEMVLEQVAGALFASSSGARYEVRTEQLDDVERELLEAAGRAASVSRVEHWHRKTGKVVGAAVGVERSGSLQIFSGVNFELSQPAGSRCAEQIALGAALARFGDSLHPSDVRRIAVIAGTNVPKPAENPLPPCGVCCEMIHKLNGERQILLYMQAESPGGRVFRIPFDEYYPPRIR